ncbi:MAG TPA: glycoside hydrolase domain-containing protein [Stellaceae bacterium]|nr:glycoside hydrolase domain-containing protein [Stellaceae bacterium]
MHAQGYACAIRYLSRVSSQNVGDLSAGEAQVILGTGLALMVVQHCAAAYWTPSAALGTSYGKIAAGNAAALGYPPPATIWLDLENMRPGCGAPAICTYANAWGRAVRGAGYQDGLYFSADCPLTPEQLYLDLITARYWRALSRDTPAVAVRGACMQQYLQAGQVAGIDIDRDVITADALGGLPVWAIA